MDEVGQAFDDSGLEADFQQASRQLANPPRVGQKSLLLLGSLAAFVAVSMAQGTSSLFDLATLVGVLLVHELGHAIAMLVVGYRDVRIFFIPFFGAAAAGRKQGVARWKQAIVLLAGPVPGVVAGGLFLIVDTPVPRMVALQLLVINGLNLLPLVPLDGGQLAQLLLFSRQRHLEVVFQGLTAAALLAFAISKKLWVLAIIGYLLLVTLAHRKRMLDIAQRWRERSPSEDPAALDEAGRRDLFRDVWNALPPQWQQKWRGKPRAFANNMQYVLERAAQKPASWSASGAILVAWAAAIAFGAWSLNGAFALHWRMYRNDIGHFTAVMPGEPKALANAGPMGQGVIVDRGSRGYSIVWFPLPPGLEGHWADAAHDGVGSKFHIDREVATDLPHERRFVYTEKGVVVVTRLLEANHRAYVITAGAPDEETDSWKFVESVVPQP